MRNIDVRLLSTYILNLSRESDVRGSEQKKEDERTFHIILASIFQNSMLLPWANTSNNKEQAYQYTANRYTLIPQLNSTHYSIWQNIYL